MNERLKLWNAARELAEAGVPGTLVTVSRHRGSLPMARDAKLLVAAGRRWGTVGGGSVEAAVIERAPEVAQSRAPAFTRHSLNADVAGELGLACGGTVDFFLEPLVASPAMARLYGAVAAAIEHRCPARVLTAIDWRGGPRKTAAVGDECIAVGERIESPPPPPPNLPPGAPFVDEARGTLVEPIRRLPRVIIFGAGHVGAEIARLAAGVGFYVVVVDDRPEFANAERCAGANEILVEDFRIVLERFAFDEDDYVLATTRGHSYDAYIVGKVAPSRARYVGMLGSKRKRAVIWRALEQSGVPAHPLERVRAPIGEDIGAGTPAEIAVAVVAQLIRHRRRGAALTAGSPAAAPGASPPTVGPGR